MKKNLFYAIIFYALACLSWGGYVWGMATGSDSTLFKTIAVVLLAIAFVQLIIFTIKLGKSVFKKKTTDKQSNQ